MAKRRVVVTGMGAVTPFGVSVARLWEALVEGRSGITPVSLFDASDFDVRIGGECTSFDAADYLDRKALKRLYADERVIYCDWNLLAA